MEPLIKGYNHTGNGAPKIMLGYIGLWLARNEGMDAYGSPYITHYSSYHVPFHSFISS